MATSPSDTPIKRREVEGTRRKDRSHSAECNSLLDSALAVLPKDLEAEALPAQVKNALLKHRESLQQIGQSAPDREKACTALLSFINKTVLELHPDLKQLDKEKHLVFFNNPSSASSATPYHPRDNVKDEPDISVTLQRYLDGYNDAVTLRSAENVCKPPRFPWHLTLSVIEVKGNGSRYDGERQVAAYAGSLNQARPDQPEAYALCLDPQGYRVCWSSAAGFYTSPRQLFQSGTDVADFNYLFRYVTSLYLPPEGHLRRDPEISLFMDDAKSGDEPGPNPYLEPPRWMVKGYDFPFCSCTVGRAHSRMTHVFKPCDRQLPVFKISWHPVERRYSEDQLLSHIHKDGYVPGVIRHDTYIKRPTILLPVVNSEQPQLERCCLDMYSTGEGLVKCKDNLEFLMTIYDLVEIHRFLVEHRSVLHRDISLNNVYCHPVHHVPPSDNKCIRKGPMFIKEILGMRDEAQNVDTSPMCMLADFDCAARFPHTLQRDNKRQRTGTPMFIARSVAVSNVCGSEEWEPSSFPEMEPKSDAASLYEKAYGSFKQDPFSSAWNSTVCEFKDPKLRGPRPHEPYHDVESMYWIMAVFLLKVLPLTPMTPETELSLANLDNTWKLFSGHTMGTGSRDSREDFFNHSDMLHPDVEAFGYSILSSLRRYVKPDYFRLGTPPPPFHLHECFRRRLLHAIVKARPNPLAFNTEKRRNPRGERSPESHSSVSSAWTREGNSSLKRKGRMSASSSGGSGLGPHIQKRPKKTSPCPSPLGSPAERPFDKSNPTK